MGFMAGMPRFGEASLPVYFTHFKLLSWVDAFRVRAAEKVCGRAGAGAESASA
jgi:hypothetical protein